MRARRASGDAHKSQQRIQARIHEAIQDTAMYSLQKIGIGYRLYAIQLYAP